MCGLHGNSLGGEALQKMNADNSLGSFATEESKESGVVTDSGSGWG